MIQVIVCAVVGDSPRQSDEESYHREYLILAWIKGKLHPYGVTKNHTIEST
jgi:hypothetical protein